LADERGQGIAVGRRGGVPNLNSFFDDAAKCSNHVRTRNLGSRYDVLLFELKSFDRSQVLSLAKDLTLGGGRKV
jgi:hypothetical protein